MQNTKLAIKFTMLKLPTYSTNVHKLLFLRKKSNMHTNIISQKLSTHHNVTIITLQFKNLQTTYKHHQKSHRYNPSSRAPLTINPDINQPKIKPI